MKKEVSCKVLQAYFSWVRKKNIPPEALCAGVAYPLSVLRNRHERIEWDVFCKVTANLRHFLSDKDFVDLGYETATSGPLLVGVSAIGRFLFSGPEFYWWLNSNSKGPGAQLFTCIISSTRQVEKNHLAVTLLLAPDHEYCHEFFVITKGALASASTLIGLDPSRVEMREVERGAVYDIYCPEGGGALSWVRRAVTWPFAARTAARELKEANEALHERYAQLEEAQSRIQHQATQLRTAFSISEHIRSNLDLEATIEAVAQSLVEEAHFAGAKVEVCSKTDVEEVHRVALKGAEPSEERVLTRTLEARGQNLGAFSVSLHADADLHEAQELLDQIAPGIAMEISDALSFTLLTGYRNRDRLMQEEFSRQQIESQEAERKRLAAELHDGLGQDLLVMNNELQQFMQENKESREKLKQVASLIQESIEGVREISANLHPHHLDRLGLRAALEATAEKLSRSSGLNVCLTGDTIDGLFLKETEIHLYRIIQEALSNVVCHACAKSVDVAMKKNSGSIEITVRDDGRGFDANRVRERRPSSGSDERLRGFGLSSMSERVRIVGGTIQITSMADAGTTVHITVPFGAMR